MRPIVTLGTLALLWTVAPALAQTMSEPGQSSQAPAQSQPSGEMMMCGGGTTGQGTQDKTSKPMQMACACCQNMMKKGAMPKQGMEGHN